MRLLRAQVLQARRRREPGLHEAVVETHLAAIAVDADLHADVAEPVELRAHLADLGRDEIVVPDDLVLAEQAAIRRPRDPHHELARAEQRHLRRVRMPQLAGLALVAFPRVRAVPPRPWCTSWSSRPRRPPPTARSATIGCRSACPSCRPRPTACRRSPASLPLHSAQAAPVLSTSAGSGEPRA